MAEQLVNEFTVNRPIDEAWPLICNLELIAPCMPGAQLEEIEGDVYRGNVAIKLGSVAVKFKGDAHFVERDDDAHTARLAAQGRDTKGRGNAKADISAHATELSPTSTAVHITTDLSIAGKVAQFGGRGIMADVSKKLVNEFASNLNQMIEDQPTATKASTAAGTEHTSTAGSGNTSDKAHSTATSGSTTTTGGDDHGREGVRKIDSPEAEPIRVAGFAGPAIAKRAIPLGVGALAVLFLVRKLFFNG